MFKKKEKSNASNNKIITLTNSNSQFNYSEVYRQIKTSIDYSNISKGTKVINITSTMPGEGKTTTALNLAVTYAGFYENVLLIDCDFRKPQIHKYFKLSNKEGLSTLLLEYSQSGKINTNYFKNIKHSSFKNKLTVLPTGTKVPNPTDLLSSDTFKNFLEEQKKNFDFIILDCPPIGAVSDAIPVGNIVDGTVFVCSSAKTSRKEAHSAVDRLKASGCNIIGAILTQADEKQSGHYGYYY